MPTLTSGRSDTLGVVVDCEVCELDKMMPVVVAAMVPAPAMSDGMSKGDVDIVVKRGGEDDGGRVRALLKNGSVAPC